MHIINTNAKRLSDAEHRACLHRAVIASTVGTTIEWYDFLLYTIVTGLVFGSLYFPDADPLVGALKAFGVFFVGFLARPIGAVIFGHYGDRLGRKATLIVTLLMTGMATAAVGLVPSYQAIGIWGGIILTMLRIVQGIGVGGEWGGSVVLAMEWANTNTNRGLIASWPQLGAPAGTCLAYIAVLATSWLSGDQFMTWGWRIPFLLSIGMVGLGLWMRLGVPCSRPASDRSWQGAPKTRSTQCLSTKCSCRNRHRYRQERRQGLRECTAPWVRTNSLAGMT